MPAKRNSSAPRPRLADAFERVRGEPVAIFGVCFAYRGVVAEVGDDHVRLAQPRMIEHTGSASAPRAQDEEPLPGDCLIAFGAIELVYWPAWVAADLEIGG